MYKVLDLFAGAGGLSFGFAQAGGFEITVAVENNTSAQETYKCNHQVEHVLGDIKQITNYEEFKAKYGEFDVVIGGPPCQGFSNANRQKNHIISQNNGLIKKYVEMIEQLSPQVFVMENVRMLRSEIHRFFYAKTDKKAVDELKLHMRPEIIYLYEGKCGVEGVLDIIQDKRVLQQAMLPDRVMHAVRLLLKNSRLADKRQDYLETKGAAVARAVSALPPLQTTVPSSYQKVSEKALHCILNFVSGAVAFENAEPTIAEFIEIQQLFRRALELLENEIIRDRIDMDDSGIYVGVSSYSVVDYIQAKLGRKYAITDGVLNSAWFGVPQLRERYIAIGINKSTCGSEVLPQLPEQLVQPDQYTTVRDAIADLEAVQPSFRISDPPIHFQAKGLQALSPRLKDLRDSRQLCNHVTTETRETALKRFAELKQGQNFHDLDKSLIEDTYTKPERTQNSIYLRLAYDTPSGTVMNVRKSMWIHPVIDRAIGIREAARLQSFPDSFVFVGSKDSQYQQVGNAVPPMMAEAIAKKVAELLDACKNAQNRHEERQA